MPKDNTFSIYMELKDEYLVDKKTLGVPSKKLDMPIKFLSLPASSLIEFMSRKRKSSDLDFSLTDHGHKVLNAEQVKFYDNLVSNGLTKRVSFGFACAISIRYHVEDAVLIEYANTRMQERVESARLEYRTAKARAKFLRLMLIKRKKEQRAFLATEIGSRFKEETKTDTKPTKKTKRK